MLRKAFILLLVTLFAAASVLSSCKKKETDNAPQASPSPVSETEALATDATDEATLPEPILSPTQAPIPESTTPSTAREISVGSSEFERNDEQLDIFIEFPVISGLPDELGADVNKILKDTAFADYYEDHPDSGTELRVSFEATYLDEKLISVAYTETGYFSSAAHPFQLARAVTIDLETGKRLRLAEILDMQTVKSALDSSEFTLAQGVKEAFWEPTLFNTWFDQFDRGGEEPHYTDFYLDAENLFLIFEVNHAFGDYIVVSCPLSALK